MLSRNARSTLRFLQILKNSTSQNEPTFLAQVKRRRQTTSVVSSSPFSEGVLKDDRDVEVSPGVAIHDAFTGENLNFEWESSLSQLQRKKFDEIKMEYIIWSNADERIPTPEIISESDWMTILDEPNAEARLRTYMYFSLRKRLKMKSKEKVPHVKRLYESSHAERIERRKAGQLDYGFFGGNFVLQRIDQTTIMKYIHTALFIFILFLVLFRWKTNRVPNTCQLNPPLIMDLSLFRYLDCSRDINLTAKQIKFCYALNIAHRQPFNLIFTGYESNAKWASMFNKQFYPKGISAFPVTVTEKSYMDLYPHEKLVYLSPDAPETLREFDSDNVYIIGAMVDKTSSRKNLTYGIAKRLGIRSQRLPLEEHLR
uniref:SAM-dependent MTase TRM10-type domain-containing protein n=1 Tax=Romanomermis culicivorax TaxID=13658 RepID=A0A915IZD0_ROMCU